MTESLRQWILNCRIARVLRLSWNIQTDAKVQKSRSVHKQEQPLWRRPHRSRRILNPSSKYRSASRFPSPNQRGNGRLNMPYASQPIPTKPAPIEQVPVRKDKDALESYTSGCLRVAQFIARHKPFLVDFFVPIAGAHD